jgi:hypothetical protein
VQLVASPVGGDLRFPYVAADEETATPKRPVEQPIYTELDNLYRHVPTRIAINLARGIGDM